MERDIAQAESLPFVEAIEVDGSDVTVVINGECFTVNTPPNYPAGSPSVDVFGQMVMLKPGTLAMYCRELHELCKTMPRQDSGRQVSQLEMDVEPCAAFLRDVDGVKRVFGPDSVSYRKIDAFTEGTYRAIVELNLDPRPLMTKMIASAYGVDYTKPIVMRLTIMDIASYNEMRETKMECFQTSRNSNLAKQLERIFTAPGRIVSIWNTDENAKGKRITVTPPPSFVDETTDERPAKVSKPSEKQSFIRKALIDMGFDAHKAQTASQIAQSVDEAAHLIMDHPEALVEHEGLPQRSVADRSADAKAQQEVLRCISNGTNVLTSGEKDENKAIPARTNGFLVQLMQYAIHRIKSCANYCVICDQTHLFSGGVMLKPAVCNRDLCVFAFNDLGVGANAADEVATDAGVIDLLICMLKAAAFSSRTDRILTPFPAIADPSNPRALVLNPQKPDVEKVREVLSKFPSVRTISQANDFGEMKLKLDMINPLAFPLMQWCINSNRSHIVKLRKEDHFARMCTPHQYMLLTATPAKQAKFAELKKKYGVKWGFHGSGIENWHCILREGLKNASGTKLQVNGTAHGNGIYFGLTAETSLGYCRTFTLESGDQKDNAAPKKGTGTFINERNMICLALCEIVNQSIKDHGWCWTLEDEDHCMTRYFFVYEENNTGNAGKADAQSKEFLDEIQRSMKLHGIT